MSRLLPLIVAFFLAAGPALAAPHLDRVILVLRHGVRPPTLSNEALAKFADQPWPAWPAAPGELTPRGGEGVRIVGETVSAAYRKAGLLPGGCASDGPVSVWADNADQRTRETGRIFATALGHGCALTAHWSPISDRDPIFSGTDQGACKVDPDAQLVAAQAIKGDPLIAAPLGRANARLQAILAPHACTGGPGVCLTQPTPSASAGPPGITAMFPAAALAEDLYLEYADGMPMSKVGWGRASRADITTVMAIHEHAFALIRDNAYLADRRGATMARILLGALAGSPVAGGPQSGPDTRLLAFAGHDSNLAWMGGVLGLDWRFANNPEFASPATTLALEIWSDHGRQYVRPVIFYLGLDQQRALAPGRAHSMPLRFNGCVDGPMGSCSLATLRERVLAKLPADCGEL